MTREFLLRLNCLIANHENEAGLMVDIVRKTPILSRKEMTSTWYCLIDTYLFYNNAGFLLYRDYNQCSLKTLSNLYNRKTRCRRIDIFFYIFLLLFSLCFSDSLTLFLAIKSPVLFKQTRLTGVVLVFSQLPIDLVRKPLMIYDLVCGQFFENAITTQ